MNDLKWVHFLSAMMTHLRCKDFPNNLAAYRRNHNEIQFLDLGGIETVISTDIMVLARRPHGCIFTECNIHKLTSTIWMGCFLSREMCVGGIIDVHLTCNFSSNMYCAHNKFE